MCMCRLGASHEPPVASAESRQLAVVAQLRRDVFQRHAAPQLAELRALARRRMRHSHPAALRELGLASLTEPQA